MKFEDYKYERPDYDEYGKIVNGLAEKLASSTNLEEAIQIIDQFNKVSGHTLSMEQLVGIRNSIDTKDEFYEKEQEFIDENSPKARVADNVFSNVLLNHQFLPQFKEKYGTQWFKSMEIENKWFSDKIVDELAEESKLVTRYEKLLASAKISFDGKINNLSQMGVYAQSPNREIRRMAEIKKAEFFTSIQDELDDIYDKLVKVRNRMAQKAGYDNYVEFGYYRLGRSDYNYKDVQRYRDIILKEVVPLSNKIRENQKKRLGLDSLKFYDLALWFKEGNPDPRGSVDELVAKAYSMYSELSPETKEFFKYMMDHNLLDLETKPNKRGGGYTEYVSEFKAPFIFSNFNGTSADVDVLTHEAGHAFQVYTSSKVLSVPSVFWPTLEACEIHSMSMEFFTHPWMEYFFGSDANKYRYKHTVESILFLPYGVAVDEFQEYAYLNPNVSKEERRAKWREIEKKYMPYKDYDGIEYYENGGFWQKQSHIYANAFYYIDYTLAQICAFNFFLLDLKNHKKAFNQYLELCKLGGSESFFELLRDTNQGNPFEDGVVRDCIKQLEKVVKKLEKEI